MKRISVLLMVLAVFGVFASPVLAAGGTGSSLNPTADRATATFVASYADTVASYGAVVDLGSSNPYKSVMFLITVGVFADSSHSGKYTFSFQDSSTTGGYTTAAAPHLVGTCPILVDSADGSQVYSVQYLRHKRWIRPKWIVTGGPAGVNVDAPFSIVAIKNDPKYTPVR